MGSLDMHECSAIPAGVNGTEFRLKKELEEAKAEYVHANVAPAVGVDAENIMRLRNRAISRYSKALREFSDFVLRRTGGFRS